MDIVTKAGWNSRNTTVLKNIGQLPRVYIHHTAGYHPTNQKEEVDQMHVLQHIAIDMKYHQDIEYNWVVGPSGLVYEARGLAKLSAATADQNSISRSICLMGNFHNVDVPTGPSITAVCDLIIYLIDHWDLQPSRKLEIFGHRDSPAHPNATACPGDAVEKYMDYIRSVVISHLPPPTKEDEYMLAPRLVRQNGYINVLLIEGASVVALPPELFDSYVAENPSIVKIFYHDTNQKENFYAQCKVAGLDPSKLTTGGSDVQF